MVFLKKFYAEGFKSFAKPITLHFNSTMIGIVGPNGSGKSNIVDALKWAMGEQSVKTLRGKEKSNLIFAGSNDLKPADFALVELTFDNSSRILHHNTDEVKISRKLIKKSGETIYTLNDEPCLLKDIQTIFIDSGLSGKGSLSIISQGSVNWFVEAKPEERRKMFESAAGIGKYIKQKNETTDHLQKAIGNLEKLSITLNSLRRDVKELNKQAEKAQQYKEKKEKLQEYDLCVSTQDYLTWKDESNELKEKIQIEKEQLDSLALNITKARELSEEYRDKYIEIDSKVKELSNQKTDLNQQISQLNITRATYITNLENNLSSSNIQERINSYKSLIASEKEQVNSLKNQLNNSKNEDLENTQKLNDVIKRQNELRENFDKIKNDYFSKKATLDQLRNQSNNSNSHDRGIRELLLAKNRISGIHSTIQNIIKVKERYEIAIQTALGKSVSNLVVDNDQVAVKCINYLKQNHCGRATLLPLNTIRRKDISPATLTILKQMNGFVDIANNLIDCDSKYDNVISSLLGNICVSDTIENANIISKTINSNYKIITLDGDTVFAGGAMAGGETLGNRSILFNLEEKLKKAAEEFESIRSQYEHLTIENEKISEEFKAISVKKQMNVYLIDKLTNQLSDSTSKVTRFENELDAIDITEDKEKNETKINQFEYDLLALNEKLAIVDRDLVEAEKVKEIRFDESSKYNFEYQESLKKESEITLTYSQHNSKYETLINNINTLEDRIVTDYGMVMDIVIEQYNRPLDLTLNEARKIISNLKSEINALGNINFQALESLEEKENKLKELEKESNDVKDSVNQLTNLLEELDRRAKNDFVSVINKVNEIIPKVFTNLFGGGTCKIEIVDPNNVLESGIDVIAQPPGKKISNLVLLSGGEKTLIALAVLFSLLNSSNFPLVLLDEAEAALDQANVNTFAKLIQEFSETCQFLVITHRTGTMKMCDILYGTMMQVKGVTSVTKTSYDVVSKINNKG